MKRKQTPFRKSRIYVVLLIVLFLIVAAVSVFVLEPMLKMREIIWQATRIYIEATAEERITQTQQVYLAKSTVTPVSNLQVTLAAVETEVIASIIAEEAETIEAIRTYSALPQPTWMPLQQAGTATQRVILTQIALTSTPTAP
jgi:hypothetical protein